MGRWTKEEHNLFLEGLRLHGKEWKSIADMIPTRTVVQIRTHAQKYFQKVAKNRQSSGSPVPNALVSTASNARMAAAAASIANTTSRGKDPSVLWALPSEFGGVAPAMNHASSSSGSGPSAPRATPSTGSGPGSRPRSTSASSGGSNGSGSRRRSGAAGSSHVPGTQSTALASAQLAGIDASRTGGPRKARSQSVSKASAQSAKPLATGAQHDASIAPARKIKIYSFDTPPSNGFRDDLRYVLDASPTSVSDLLRFEGTVLFPPFSVTHEEAPPRKRSRTQAAVSTTSSLQTAFVDTAEDEAAGEWLNSDEPTDNELADVDFSHHFASELLAIDGETFAVHDHNFALEDVAGW